MRSKPPCHREGGRLVDRLPQVTQLASTRRRSGSLGALVAAASISAYVGELVADLAERRAQSAASAPAIRAQPIFGAGGPVPSDPAPSVKTDRSAGRR